MGIDLVDKEGTRIQGTFFNEQATKFQPELEENACYVISGGKIKLANKKYTSIKNDHCITFDESTKIVKVNDADAIEGDAFSFSNLEEIKSKVQNVTVDVIGVILDVGAPSEINLRDGSTKMKRSLQIGDETNLMIGVTLWGDVTTAYDFENGRVVAFRSCRVSDYAGKSLNASSEISDTVIEPKHPRTLQL